MKWPFWTRPQPVTLDNCETIDPLLSLYADGMASSEEARRVTAHLPGCDSCRESLAWMQATQRALAGRPVVRPPAALRARIAAAIAASSAAPISVSSAARPARSFALRPAYAAAASLAILGIVSYSVLHSPQNVHHTITPHNQVAGLPPIENSSPTVKPTVPDVILKPTIKHHSHGSVKPAPINRPLVASNPTDAESSSPPVKVKVPVLAHRTVKVAEKPSPTLSSTIKPHIPTVKKNVQPAPLMASTKAPTASVETHKAPVVQPEIKKPAPVVAALPKLASPAIIEQQPIVTQDPPARVASNHSNNPLGMVNDYARRLRTAEFKAKVARSVSNAALIVPTIDQDKKPGIDTVSGHF